MHMESPGVKDEAQSLLSADPLVSTTDAEIPKRVRIKFRSAASAAAASAVQKCCSRFGALMLAFLYIMPVSALWFTAMLLGARPFRYCNFVIWIYVTVTAGLITGMALLISSSIQLVRSSSRPNATQSPTAKGTGVQGGMLRCAFRLVCKSFVLLLLSFSAVIAPVLSTMVLRLHLTVMDWDAVTELRAVDSVIRIRRNADGLPSMMAGTLLDTIFAQGYLHARDQLFRLEVQRLAGRGQLSALVGLSAVGVDIVTRTLDFDGIAEEVSSQLSDTAQRYCEAYASGINTALQRSNFRWSAEFYFLWHTPQPWTVKDVVLAFKLFQFLTTTVNDMELLRWQLFAGPLSLSFADIETLIPLHQPFTPVNQSQGTEELNSIQAQLQRSVQGESEMYAKLRQMVKNKPESGGATTQANWLGSLWFKFHALAVGPTQYEGHLKRSKLRNAESLSQFPALGRGIEALRNIAGYWAGGIVWAYRDDHSPSHNKAFLAMEATGGSGGSQLWYPILVAAGDFPSAEMAQTLVTYPGFPGSIMGRNSMLSWGATLLMSDQTDYFVLSETGDKKGYVHSGQDILYVTTDQVITIKGSAPVSLHVRRSVYGPVVTEALGLAGDLPIAINCRALQVDPQSLEAFAALSAAQSIPAFQTQLSSLASPALAFVVVDKQGTMSWMTSGDHQIRAEAHTGRYPILGTGEYDYVGSVDPLAMPRLSQLTGTLVAAGNAPSKFGMVGSTSLGHDFLPSFRYDRTLKLLHLMNSHPTIADHMLFQTDNVDAFATSEFRAFLGQLPIPDTDNALSLRKELLEFWDGQMDGGSYSRMYVAFRNKLSEALQDWVYQGAETTMQRHWPSDDSWFVLHWLRNPPPSLQAHCASVTSRPVSAGVCLTWASSIWVTLVQEVFPIYLNSKTPVVNQECRLHHPIMEQAGWGWGCMWQRPYLKGGDRHTVSEVHCDRTTPRVPTLQMVVDTNSWAVLLQLPLGHSSHPFDRHYDSFAADYARNEYRLVSPD